VVSLIHAKIYDRFVMTFANRVNHQPKTGMNMSNFYRATALAAAFVCLPLSAMAQSTVTLYGRVNTTVESQKFAGQERQTVVANNASRFGFTGSEDLGGGLKAIFRLESGFDSDTGATTRFNGSNALFGRTAIVGLSGGFGTIRAGQQDYLPAYLATADYVSLHNHDTGSSSDALFGGFQLPGRQTNSLSYTTPSFGGVTLEIAQSLKERAPGALTQTDIAANYVAGPLHLGAGYQKIGDNKLLALRALYEFGAVTLGGYYERDDFVVLGDRNNVRISAMYTLGASEFHANVGAAGKFSNRADSKAQQYTLGYNYNLSKRTKVYGYVTRVNDGAAAVYGGDFNSTAIGVRHNF
jgi:predicted porin